MLTLGIGIEAGVAAGVLLSLLLHLYKTSRPHVAVLGLVPGTQHFRNIKRHDVETRPGLLMLRIDESLYFVNARFLEDLILSHLAADPDLKHVVLMCSAVNEIDYSALESLEEINARLTEQGIGFHLSEVKGPVMDKLRSTNFARKMNGEVFLSQFDAWSKLAA